MLFCAGSASGTIHRREAWAVRVNGSGYLSAVPGGSLLIVCGRASGNSADFRDILDRDCHSRPERPV